MAGVMRRLRRGAAATEFVFTAPIMLLMVAGIFELSTFIGRFHMLQRAARDGARVGSVTLEGEEADGSLITAAAEAQANLVLTSGGLPCTGSCAVNAQWVLDEDLGLRFVVVTVTYPYLPLTDVLPFLNGDTVSQFTMVTQQQ